MKKSLFALALTGALAFSSAQALTANEDMNAAQYTKGTTFYGSIRLGLDLGENHGDKRGLDVVDYNSRIGFKGGEDLGNGTWAIYKAEFGFNAAEDSDAAGGLKARNAFIGLYNAGWGALTIGRQDNPFSVSIIKGTAMDDYYVGYDNNSGFVSAGVWAAYQNLGMKVTDRVGNSIAYTSPNWSGFDFQVAAIMQKDDKKRGIDAVSAGLNYKHESGFVANAAYMQSNVKKGEKTPHSYGVKLGYESDAFRISAGYVGGQDAGKQKAHGWDVAADYSFGADLGSTIRANFGQGKVKDGAKATTWAVGFEQHLSSRTRAFVEYASFEIKNGDDKDTLGLGIRHDF